MFKKLIDKLFLVKEIFSKEGELHFRRWRFLETPWLRLYLHRISKHDEDSHPHNHPWHFKSLILKGSYKEAYKTGPDYNLTIHEIRVPGDIVSHDRSDVHQIKSVSGNVWTLVLAYGKYQQWGYRLKDINNGDKFTHWCDHIEYRERKRLGILDVQGRRLPPPGLIDIGENPTIHPVKFQSRLWDLMDRDRYR